MKNLFACIFLFFGLLAGCQPTPSGAEATPPASAGQAEHQFPAISSLAFGSCGHETQPQPILAQAAAGQPDLFVFLGDNIYGDTKEMDTLKVKYGRLGAKAEFQQLWESTRVVATWDDHDFGWNDAGRQYAYKEASKEIFLDFWQVDSSDVRHTRPGIYTSYMFGEGDKSLQVILLDNRTFRDKLRRYDGEAVDTTIFHYPIDYWPYETPDSTLLGAAQWSWLEEQLKVPARIRIIATSTQFGISWNGYEAWANFPHERQRLLDLIKQTQAGGVMFISGDVHYAEISRLEEEGLYPLYDITSSGITSTWHFATSNDNRVDGPVMENHFGRIDIDWDAEDPEILVRVIDVEETERIRRSIKLSEITP